MGKGNHGSWTPERKSKWMKARWGVKFVTKDEASFNTDETVEKTETVDEKKEEAPPA